MPISLDITDATRIAQVAGECGDMTLLVNNAGVMLASTFVVAVHASFVDTEMAVLANVPKISPQSVARQAFDAVEASTIEVLADERSRFVKASLSHDHELIYPPVQAFWDEAAGGGP
jgi:hypothetical protein